MGSVIRTVILDWSGTLVDDFPAVLEATNYVLRQAGQPEMSSERFRREFELPYSVFYRRLIPEVPLSRLDGWYDESFSKLAGSVNELPHAREFLEFCVSRQIRTILLSTVRQTHFAAQVQVSRLNQLLDVAYVEIHDKRPMVREILERHQLDPTETVFVGDMVHDIEAARVGGIKSVAVLTGFAGPRELLGADPDLVVEHLGELRRLLEANRLELPAKRMLPGTETALRWPIATVGAAVFDASGRVLMIRTHKWSNRWGIPGGKIKYREASEAALRRELREETGLEVDGIRFVLVQDCIGSQEFYRDEHFLLLNYTCRVDRDQPVRLNHEAHEFLWVTLDAALSMDLNQPTRVLLEALVAASPASRGGTAPALAPIPADSH